MPGVGDVPSLATPEPLGDLTGPTPQLEPSHTPTVRKTEPSLFLRRLEDLLVALIIRDQRCRETTQQAFCKYTNYGISTQIHTCKEPSSLYGGFICLEHAQ